MKHSIVQYIKIKGLFLLLISTTFSFASDPYCPNFVEKVTDEFSLKYLNPKPFTIEKLSFPAVDRTLFRGVWAKHPSYDLEKVVRGLFEEKNWILGSPLHYGIYSVLSGERTLESKFIPVGGLPLPMKDYFQIRGILPNIQTLLDCISKDSKKFTPEILNEYARKLVEESFLNLSKSSDFENYFFNMHWSSYTDSAIQSLGLGNNAIDFVIGSYFDGIASEYGPKILVYKDIHKRAIDLCAYSYIKNKEYCNNWVDYGEVNTPGYIRADELLGYQIREKDRLTSGWGRAESNNGIQYAFYKKNLNGKRVVVVLDGRGKQCILEGKDGSYYYCDYLKAGALKAGPTGELSSDNLSIVYNLHFPEVLNESKEKRVPVIGLLYLEEEVKKKTKKENAANPVAVTPTFEEMIQSSTDPVFTKKSRNELTKEVLKQISDLTINDKKLIYLSLTDKSPIKPKGIQVISAVYGETLSTAVDVIGNAASFLNGKYSEEFKVYLK